MEASVKTFSFLYQQVQPQQRSLQSVMMLPGGPYQVDFVLEEAEYFHRLPI